MKMNYVTILIEIDWSVDDQWSGPWTIYGSKGETGVKAFPDDEASIKGEGQILVDSFHPRRSLIVPRSIVSRLCVYVCVCVIVRRGCPVQLLRFPLLWTRLFNSLFSHPNLFSTPPPFFQISLAFRSNAQPSPLADQSASASFDYHFT